MRVGIVGASGYTGVELARLLSNCDGVELTVATSRQYAGQSLSETFPSLRGIAELVCENLPVEELADRADFFFTAVPHQTAMDIVPSLLGAGKKVVDLSADFRLRNAAVYEQWYQAHSAREFLAEAVYGLPELYRQQIGAARLVANPGCYPTSVILGLAPLLKEGLIDPATVIADSKSGTSGAGRSANVETLFCEVTDGFRAYNVGRHRHTPEMEQEISALCGQDVKILFSPHLLPVSRGIYSTIYAVLNNSSSLPDIHALYSSFYGDEHFVRLLPMGQLPSTQSVRGSNYIDIGLVVDERTGRVVVLCTIDNLVKGAAGQAVQNMNIMCGFPEQQGLGVVPLFP